jgi:ABC transporter substrate binding protein (PQQ-dependent alcohol dehydrogenase system)
MIKLCGLVLPRVILALFAAAASVLSGAGSHAQTADVHVIIGYLERIVPPPPVLSNLDPVPEDEGIQGVRLGIADNATTGKFLGQSYELIEANAEDDDAFLAAGAALLKQTPFLIVDAPAEQLLALSRLPEAEQAILFNISAADTSLRSGECSANILHTIPSRAMLADALSQFAVKKRWTRWAMISGDRPSDQSFAEALRNSASKFRLELVGEKTWKFDADMRRSAGSEVPLFTQDFPDHDLLVIADEANDFGRYVLYNTWLPRPAGGSEGITPSGWSASVEEFGAAQLQSRFREMASRDMRAVDYAGWLAVRAIGEAVTRTGKAEAGALRDYLLSDEFQLAGFKGRPLTFRKWNGQMRQPVPLTHPHAVVMQTPVEGFLHKRNELDTLGLDYRESGCSAFGYRE